MDSTVDVEKVAKIAMGVGALAVVAAVGNALATPEEATGGSGPFGVLYEWASVLRPVQIALGILTFVAGAGLFRSKDWARPLLELACWLHSVAFLALCVSTVLVAHLRHETMNNVFTALYVISGVFWSVVFVRAGLFVRSDGFRRAEEKDRGA